MQSEKGRYLFSERFVTRLPPCCVSLVGLKRAGAARPAAMTAMESVHRVPCVRAFSSLEKKEKGDEARYFAQEDARKLAEMRAKVDTILAQDDSSEEKTELLGLLGKPEILIFHGLTELLSQRMMMVNKLSTSFFTLNRSCALRSAN